jgi:hypothetical protein
MPMPPGPRQPYPPGQLNRNIYNNNYPTERAPFIQPNISQTAPVPTTQMLNNPIPGIKTFFSGNDFLQN